jgi:hypothetical protein
MTFPERPRRGVRRMAEAQRAAGRASLSRAGAGRRSALASPVTAAILGTLQDAVELDAIRADLLAVVDQVLEPASVSVWMSERG